jgi:streptogramin lyase
VLGYDATTLQQVMTFCASPNGLSYGGIWMSNAGPAADAAGNLYFTTGNGPFDPNAGEYGDSLVKLSPAGAVLDYFTPYNQDSLSSADLDFGSSGVVLLPDQPGAHPHLAVTAGKDGAINLVDRGGMGHFNPTDNSQIVQWLPNSFLSGSGLLRGNFQAPVYFNGTVYFGPVGAAVKAFPLSNGLLSATPTSETSTVFGYPGGALAISANGSADGVLWAVERAGVLHAYDPSNLATELYNSNQAGTRDTLGTGAKFSIPLVANGKVFVGTTTQLVVYGLLP